MSSLRYKKIISTADTVYLNAIGNTEIVTFLELFAFLLSAKEARKNAEGLSRQVLPEISVMHTLAAFP